MYRRSVVLVTLLVTSALFAQDATFSDLMGDDYYEPATDAPPHEQRKFSRAVGRNLLDRITDSYWRQKHALDANWSNGTIDRVKRHALLATLDETTKVLRDRVRGSGHEDMARDELLMFARTMAFDTDQSFGSLDIGNGANSGVVGADIRDPLADAVYSCTRYADEFTHEMTGERMTRHVEPGAGGCHYRETMPGDFQLACIWTVSERKEISEYFRYAEFYADARMTSRTKFRDGKPVTETRYELDGQDWHNPLQDDMQDGTCVVGKR